MKNLSGIKDINRTGKFIILFLSVICIVLAVFLAAEKHKSTVIKEHCLNGAESEFLNWKAELENSLTYGKDGRWEDFAVSGTRIEQLGSRISGLLQVADIAGADQNSQISSISYGIDIVLSQVRQGNTDALEDLENIQGWIDGKESVLDLSYEEFRSFLPEGFPAGYGD